MISSSLQSEVDLDDSPMSGTLSNTSNSIYPSNNGTRKMNKVRSIKLVKLPSVRLRRRQSRIQADGVSSSESSQLETDSSPNYMKTTSSSTAKDNLKKSTRSLTRRSSFKPAKSFSRLPSKKFRRPMKKSKSIKLRIRSVELPNHLKAEDSPDTENAQFQASTHTSKSSLKILRKMSSLRTNRSSMKKSSHLLERNIHRATCSSTLKDSKFPNYLESEGVSTMKVCPYSYCSLHGHRHSTLPPLKRFVSMRRRVLKSQRSRKLERQPSLPAKRSGNVKTVIRGRQTSSYKDVAVLEASRRNKVLNTTGIKDDFSASEKDGNEDEVSTLNIEVGGGDSGLVTWHEKRTICDQLEQEKNSEPAQVKNERQMEKMKHMGLWNLIYKHMATEIVTEAETQTHENETDKEDVENSDTYPLDADNNQDKGGHIQIYQKKAIKLVKVAFDKILSEIPDQSPDEQLKGSANSLNQEISKKNHEEEESKGPEASKTPSEIGSKSVKQTPSNWSNLKKLIVLNRFVKTLDKVRKFNPRKPQFLPVPTDPEAEKVQLRHQTAEEKKKSEEWMLDYALQQVISTLAPAQKQKVALLVQAFESVSPVSGNSTSTSSNVDTSSHLSYQKSPMKVEETNFGISLQKTPFPYENCTEYKQDRDSYLEFKELKLKSSTALSSLITDVTEKPSVKLADLANTSNDSLQNKEISPSKVHDVELVFNGQQGIESTSDYVLRKVEVSASEVCDRVVGLNDQHDIENTDRNVSLSVVNDPELIFNNRHDIANTSDDVLGNGEISASGVHDLDPGLGEQHDVANEQVSASEIHVLDTENTSEYVLKKVEEVSASVVGDFDLRLNDIENEPVEEVSASEARLLDSGFSHQHDVENTSSDVLANEQISASEVCDLDFEFIAQDDAANTSNDVLANGEISASEVCDLGLESNNQLLQRLQDLNTTENVNSLAPEPELEEISKEVTKGELVVNNEESNASSSDIKDEKQKNMGLWYLIYKHMVSGTKTLLNEAEHSPKLDSNQTEAIRMFEEAIDEIPLPEEIQIQSTTPNRKESPNSEETVKNKTKQEPKKSWSNLKKMILLKRFVKAMEKVKEFNPREPRFLPIDSQKEAEKVRLRHQEMEDRKNADEWMLDYTLQQVVAKLTPARKRKVQLLVEAFETVIPTIES